MHRFAWLALLTACRIGFDEIAPDAPDANGVDEPGAIIAPSGAPFMTSCIPGGECVVNCSEATSCVVSCNNAASCDVQCPPSGCSVTGCFLPTCQLECADGAPPTRYTSFATCP